MKIGFGQIIVANLAIRDPDIRKIDLNKMMITPIDTAQDGYSRVENRFPAEHNQSSEDATTAGKLLGLEIPFMYISASPLVLDALPVPLANPFNRASPFVDRFNPQYQGTQSALQDSHV